MANYVIKELPTGMGNGSEGKQFPKMQVYTEFDYNKVVELVHTNSPAFSEATVRGVLDTLAVVMKSYLPMGHTMKIDNLGVFSLSLEFADDKADVDNQQEEQGKKAQKKYHHVNIDRHGFITLQEYANLNGLNYSTASRELSKLVAAPYSGIKAKGAGSHKVWVRR